MIIDISKLKELSTRYKNKGVEIDFTFDKDGMTIVNNSNFQYRGLALDNPVWRSFYESYTYSELEDKLQYQTLDDLVDKLCDRVDDYINFNDPNNVLEGRERRKF